MKTVGPGDIDPADDRAHIRFAIAPILQNPNETDDTDWQLIEVAPGPPAPVIAAQIPSAWYARPGASITFQTAVSSWSAGSPNANGIELRFRIGQRHDPDHAVEGRGKDSALQSDPGSHRTAGSVFSGN